MSQQDEARSFDSFGEKSSDWVLEKNVMYCKVSPRNFSASHNNLLPVGGLRKTNYQHSCEFLSHRIRCIIIIKHDLSNTGAAKEVMISLK